MKKKSVYWVIALFVVVLGAVWFANGEELQGLFAIGRADLVVQDISVDSDNKLTIQVGNEGARNVSSSKSGHTYIYIEDMSDPAWTYAWSTLSDQNFRTAGSSSELQPQKINDVYTVQACVDAKEVVSESDDTNNCLTEVVEPSDAENVTRGSFLYDVFVDIDPSNALLVCEEGATSFPDVDSSNPYCGVIMAAFADGFVMGDPDGTFGPDEYLTRAEGAVWAYDIYGFTGVPPGLPIFDDTGGHSAEVEIEWLNAAGAFEYSTGSFHPDSLLTQYALDIWMSNL